MSPVTTTHDTPRGPRQRRRGLFLALLAAGLSPAACEQKKKDAAPAGAPVQATAPADAGPQRRADGSFTITYSVRGVVVQVPAPGDPRSDFQVRHEAIPEFRSGQTTGMNTMTMPFKLAEGLSLEGIARGDLVRIEFDVDYTGEYRVADFRTTKVERLPPDTALDFSPITPRGIPENPESQDGPGLP